MSGKVARILKELEPRATANTGQVAIIAPTDADTETAGHQVDLGVGTTFIIFQITAEEGPQQKYYTVTVRRAPGQVTGAMITPTVGQLVVSWAQTPGAEGYKVQWKSDVQAYDPATRQAIVPASTTDEPPDPEVQWKSGVQAYDLTTRQVTGPDGTPTSHTIPTLAAGTQYTVRVIATKAKATDSPPSIPSIEATGTPNALALLHNTPNPFNPGTTIHYAVERGQPVRLAIYNYVGASR